MRRFLSIFVLAALVAGLAGCSRHNKNVKNPLADVGSKQPDKVLFDRAMDAMKHNKFDVARLTLQTLINTYPDSEFIARAKLAVGDSWYAEGGSTALAQAENEYRDFITFFPNMTEASEAQMKIANIHYRQMEKPDRDYTHAKRAEEEYRAMLQQYPDSPLVPEAKERLREVQEVLADREFLIGRFYYLRESWPAAIARLKSVTDQYPLYSNADEALYILGQIYERQMDGIRATKLSETAKGKLLSEWADEAASIYGRIITRYPVTPRAEDAKRRIEELHRPVPTPTAEAIAQNKAEEASREELSRFGRLKLVMHKHPDFSPTSKVGEPVLTDAKQTSAPEVMREQNADLLAAAEGKPIGREAKAAAAAKTATPAANQPAPAAEPAPQGIDELKPLPDSGAAGNTVTVQPGSGAPKANEPPPSSSPNEAPPAPPAQVNEAAGANAQAATPEKPATKLDENTSSSSKSKKKKGLRKIIPF